jgi:predicted DNA binding protein
MVTQPQQRARFHRIIVRANETSALTSCDGSTYKWRKNSFSCMTLFEVVLKITHDCPFANISRRYPSLEMCSWCNGEHDVYELHVENDEEYDAVVKEVSKLGELIEESSNEQKIHLITETCACTRENSVGKNLEDFDLLHVSPVVYSKGWEYYRIIAFRHEDLKRFLERMEGPGFAYEIVRKVPFNGFIASSLTMTADALFSDLTDKQMDALMTAHNSGYYLFPRKNDIQSIAAKRRVPRTTFQEHLKKAENKIVSSLIPYIQLYRYAPIEKRESLRIK